ncbi:MAG: STAS domain-containing protein [Thermodesulfobacteriota bacterium]
MSRITGTREEVIVAPQRDVVASMATGFKAELYEIVQSRPARLTIDLSGVEMIDSVGIGVIIAAYNSLRNIGSSLEVENASRDIYNALVAMRLNHHFSIRKAKN